MCACECNMGYYNMTGSIFIEGTGEEARYDFDMEWHESDSIPDSLVALEYMMETGIIQIMHKESQLIEKF